MIYFRSINRRELGVYVGNELLVRQLEPLNSLLIPSRSHLSGYMEARSSRNYPVFNHFKEPKVLKYLLPGGFLYISGTCPESYIDSSDRLLVTGPNELNGYRVCSLKVMHFLSFAYFWSVKIFL